MVRIKELQRRSLTSFIIGSYRIIAAVMLPAAVFRVSLLKHMPFVELCSSALQVLYYTSVNCRHLLMDLQIKPKTKVKWAVTMVQFCHWMPSLWDLMSVAYCQFILHIWNNRKEITKALNTWPVIVDRQCRLTMSVVILVTDNVGTPYSWHMARHCQLTKSPQNDDQLVGRRFSSRYRPTMTGRMSRA